MELFKGIALIKTEEGKWELVVKINEIKEERLKLDDAQLSYILSVFRQG